MKHEMLQMQLHAELQKFGLNPKEWSLQPVNLPTQSGQKRSLIYLIQNRLDKNFSLFGQLTFKKERPTWKSLELASF